MSREQFLIMLQILVQNDIRVQVHSFYLLNNVYTHNEKRCPKCISTYLLEHPNEQW